MYAYASVWEISQNQHFKPMTTLPPFSLGTLYLVMIICVLLFLKSDVFLIQHYEIVKQVVTSKMQPFMPGVGKISHKYVILWQTLFERLWRLRWWILARFV